MTLRYDNSAGFTLLELMIAISLLSIVSIMAYGGLQSVLNNREAVMQTSTELEDLQRTIDFLQRDLAQLIPRSVRDENGEPRGALTGSLQSMHPLELTRSGSRSTHLGPRSSLQRIAYRQEGERLIRDAWWQLDRGYASEAMSAVMLEAVQQFEVRFLDNNDNWSVSWPPLNSFGNHDLSTMPRAVEIVLIHHHWGSIRRVIAIDLHLPEQTEPPGQNRDLMDNGEET